MKRVQVSVDLDRPIVMCDFGSCVHTIGLRFKSIQSLVSYLEEEGGHYIVDSSISIDDYEDDDVFVIVRKYIEDRGYETILAEEGYFGNTFADIAFDVG